MPRCCGAVLLMVLVGVWPHVANAQPCQLEWSKQFSADEVNGIVHAMAVFDEDGAGPGPPVLYVGGAFTMAGGVEASRIARWDGSSWSALGLGITGSSVFALAVFDDDGDGPNPPALYVAGNFNKAGLTSANNIARWSGTSWSGVGGGTGNTVYTLAVYDDDGDDPNSNPPALYAGGLFVTAGAVLANRVAQWDGDSWYALGSGMNNYVNALVVFDDDGDDPNSNPPALCATGGFVTAGGTAANYVAKWANKSWSPLQSGPSENGLNAAGYDLAVFDDDDTGPHLPALYVCGTFTVAGAGSANRVAKWDGASWSALGSGMNDPVWALASFDDDDDGPHTATLYAGGYFTVAGGAGANRIAEWNGTSWSGLAGGMNDGVRALLVFDDDGDSPDSNPSALFVGGEFTTAGGFASGHIAKWGCLGFAPPCPGDLNGDGEVELHDLAELIGNYGIMSGAIYEQGDLDGDGDVDLDDLAELLGLYGTVCW